VLNNGNVIARKEFPLLKILSRGNPVKIVGHPERSVYCGGKTNRSIVKYMNGTGRLTENYFERFLGDE